MIDLLSLQILIPFQFKGFCRQNNAINCKYLLFTIIYYHNYQPIIKYLNNLLRASFSISPTGRTRFFRAAIRYLLVKQKKRFPHRNTLIWVPGIDEIFIAPISPTSFDWMSYYPDLVATNPDGGHVHNTHPVVGFLL